jgi:putative transcriptional regulator
MQLRINSFAPFGQSAILRHIRLWIMSVSFRLYCIRARLLAGLTQEQFASICGVSVSTVNRWEKGRAMPNPEMLRKIRALFIRVAPQFNAYVIEESPGLKFSVDISDLRQVVNVSRGLLDRLDIGFNEFCDKVPGGHYTRVVEELESHPVYRQHAMAYFKTTHKACVGWVETLGVALYYTNTLVWEMSPTDKRTYKLDVVSIYDLQDRPSRMSQFIDFGLARGIHKTIP